MRKIAHPFRQELNAEERYIPDAWSSEYVASRMVMAAQTLKNMRVTGLAPAGFSSCFPEFENKQISDDEPDLEPLEEEYRNDEKTITGEDISLMEEALTWPIEYLNHCERLSTAVTQWVASDVFGVSKSFYARKKNITEYYFRKDAMQGFKVIAEKLENNGVKLR